jgi:serine/threonine protein kinase
MKHLRGGSPYWMAPEILKKEEYDQTIDIWALGITCIELAENEPPYFKLSPKEVMKQIIKSPPTGLNDKSKWSYEFNDFISCCLNEDRFKRPTAEALLKHDFITMVDKKNLNRKLLILQFLTKCGYKILYNRKVKLTPIVQRTTNNINNILYHKKGFIDIRRNNGTIFNSQILSNNKNLSNKNNVIRCYECFENNNKSTNRLYRAENIEKKNNIRISLKCSSAINKKLFIRCRSLENEIGKPNNKAIFNKINLRTNLLYKRNNHILRNTASGGNKKHFLTLENHTLNSAHSIRNLNSNNINTIDTYTYDKRNNFLKTFIKTNRTKSIMGREIKDNFDEKYEFLEEDNDEKNDKEKSSLDNEIKELLKQRDIEINNIMLKYQDKMDKMKKGHNKSLFNE